MTDTPRVPSEATTGTPTPNAAPASPAGSPGPEEQAPMGASETRPAEATEAGLDAAPSSPAATPTAEPTEPTEAAEPHAAPLVAGAPVAEPATATVEAAAAASDAADAVTAPPARAELSPAACAALLAQHFPALFGGPPKPLKLRIQADIQARAPGVFTRKALSVFLHRHTTTNAYLNALVKAAQRVDLDGADAGEIADEHRIAATEELARRRSVHETRRREARAAEQAARRAQGGNPAAAAPADAAALDASTPDGGASAAPRTPRPARPQRGADGRTGPRPERQARPGPADRPERTDRPARPVPPGPARSEARAADQTGDALPQRAAAAPLVMTEAERERAALLRAYEGSTLTRANFCVLKRIDEPTLEAQLQLARQERAARPAPPPRADFRPGDLPQHQRPGQRPSRGNDDRGPRRPRPSTPGR